MSARKGRPGLNEMRDVLSGEADRLFFAECARRKAGAGRDYARTRSIEVLDAAGDLIARLIPVHQEVSALVKHVSIAPMKRDWP